MESDIRKCWSDIEIRTDSKPGRNRRRNTALHDLKERYRQFSRMSLICAFVIPMMTINMILNHKGGISGLGIAILVIGFVFFITASMMDSWLYRGLRTIDIAEMPVAEVCRLAYYYKKKHIQFIAVLLPMAGLYIGGMGWIFSYSYYFLWGMAAGCLVGLFVGLYKLMQFMRDYRDLTLD